MKKWGIGVVLCLVCVAAAQAAPAPTVADLDRSVAKALAWFQANQNEDGSFGGRPDVGITGLVIAAIAESPEKLRATQQKTLDKAVAYLLKHAQDDGAVVEEHKKLANYKTSVAIMALCAVDQKKHAKVIEKAKNYLIGLQYDEKMGLEKSKNWEYGGIGYGSHEIPDMSNTKFAIEALKEAGVDEDSEVFKRAITFISRCQDLSSTNDVGKLPGREKIVVGGTGGMSYRPVDSKAGEIKHADGKITLRPHGSMTYAGLLSFIYAGVDKDDKRVKAAHGWISRHYTLDENPGMHHTGGPKPGKQGLYYYYHTFAKALAAYGDAHVETPDGKKHPWAKELVAKLIAMQREDGTWVNEHSRWMESDPALVTSYSLLAVAQCRDGLD
jgi:squalene-hopene/tetraprenyl-beta-curcumene cyclase